MQSIEATLQSIEAASQSIALTLQSIEATLQSIEAASQSIEAASQSIDDSYSLIETACSFCEEKWSFSDQAFPFSEENLSSIENEWKVSKQNTHSIEDADKLVETRCPVVDEEWSPVDANGSSASTKWNPISIDCSLAPIHCLFASIVCQVSSIASSFVGRRFRLNDLNDHGVPSTDPDDTQIGVKNPADLSTVRNRPHGKLENKHVLISGKLTKLPVPGFPACPDRRPLGWISVRVTLDRSASCNHVIESGRWMPWRLCSASKSPKRVADGKAGVARGRRSQVATYRREMIGSHWKGALFERCGPTLRLG